MALGPARLFKILASIATQQGEAAQAKDCRSAGAPVLCGLCGGASGGVEVGRDDCWDRDRGGYGDRGCLRRCILWIMRGLRGVDAVALAVS
jgi:hypothetical protein